MACCCAASRVCYFFCNGSGIPQTLTLTFVSFGSGIDAWADAQLQGTSWTISTSAQSCPTYSGVFGHNWSGSPCVHPSCFGGRCPKVLVTASFDSTTVNINVRISSINPCSDGFSWNSTTLPLSRDSLLCQGNSASLSLTPATSVGGVIPGIAGSVSIVISLNPLP